ncbi:MAG: hypothetical protein JO322_00820, partial [Candidatus Eremiobacteraeota bacterium]|nr:hypothetical protein [Candidatus Eremiobacteraeota bacterium]
MMTRWNRFAMHLGGAACALLWTLSGCGGGGSGSSLPAQPSQQQLGRAPAALSTTQQGPSNIAQLSATSSVRIYATNQKKNAVFVYDEQGRQLANCGFRNLKSPFDIAFDSRLQR